MRRNPDKERFSRSASASGRSLRRTVPPAGRSEPVPGHDRGQVGQIPPRGAAQHRDGIDPTLLQIVAHPVKLDGGVRQQAGPHEEGLLAHRDDYFGLAGGKGLGGPLQR